MIHVHKEYKEAFLVEPTKLRRLVDTIHGRLGDHENSALHDAFEVFFTGSRREEITKLDDVLALDNSRKQKITGLAITCSASSLGAVRPEHEVQVDFARPQTSTSSGRASLVAISVRGEGAGWANRTLAEVEEQVERNWRHDARPLGVLICLLIVALFLLVVQFVPPRPSLSSGWALSDSDFDRIEAMLAERPTLTDEDIRAVWTMQMRNLLDARKPMRSVQENRTRRTIFLVVPLLVVVACVAILLMACYPSGVFLWGDEVERYASTVHRRKTIWGIIISVTVVGISSQLFFEGVSSLLPR